MIRYIVGIEKRTLLLLLACWSLVLYLVASNVERPVAQPHLAEKLAVCRRLARAQQVVLALRAAKQVPVTTDDLLHTGWVGVPVSVVTSEPGSISAKRSTTNPNFGAAVVEMLARTGIRHGDVVAIGMSGSFPALDTAVIVSVEALGAQPIIISSVGASQWGANQPELTWQVLEQALFAAHIIHHRSIAVSRGGANNLDPVIISHLEQAAAASGLPYIDDSNLAASVRKRLKLYRQAAGGRPIACFVNVGGALPNVGESKQPVPLKATRKKPAQTGVQPAHTKHTRSGRLLERYGLLGAFTREGIITLDLRRIKPLCREYDLPWDPQVRPAAGQGSLFYQRKRSPTVIVVCLILEILGILLVSGKSFRKPSMHALELGEAVNPLESSSRQHADIFSTHMTQMEQKGPHP